MSTVTVPRSLNDAKSAAPICASAPVNYTVHVVRFAVRRESATPPPRTRSEPDAVATLARELIPDNACEYFGVFLVNTRNDLIPDHEVSTGTLCASLVHPREVFGHALRLLGVAALILVYSHPSGDPEPSPEDIQLPRQLVECAKVLALRIPDRVIVGNGSGRYVSRTSRGLI